MAGTLFGLGLSQQVSATGTPLSGCLLYLYQENSSTPVTTYSDFTLSTVQTWPIVADSAGRLPQIWVADGSYRARLTTSAGVEVFDEGSVTAIGASSSTSGGSGSSADTTSIFQTGDTLWIPYNGTRTGWVRANGRTMGNGSSGGTERANSDTQDLFEYLWNTYANATCAVSGGRGSSATADFNAAKTITLLDMRSKGALGLDDMGNTAAAVTGGSTAAAAAIGASTYTIAQANLPNVTLSSTALTITDTRIYQFSQRDPSDSENVANGGNTAANNSNVTSTINMSTPASGTLTLGGGVPLGGSGTDMDILSPALTGTWYIKL